MSKSTRERVLRLTQRGVESREVASFTDNRGLVDADPPFVPHTPVTQAQLLGVLAREIDRAVTSALPRSLFDNATSRRLSIAEFGALAR